MENGANLGSVALFLLEPNVCEYILGVESPFICDILSQVDENGLIESSDESTDEVNVSSEDGTVQIDDWKPYQVAIYYDAPSTVLFGIHEILCDFCGI